MKAENVELYTWPTCPFCNRAKRLLNELEIPFIDHDIWGKDDEKAALIERTGQTTVPYVFFGDHFIGGCDDLVAMVEAGDIEK